MYIYSSLDWKDFRSQEDPDRQNARKIQWKRVVFPGGRAVHDTYRPPPIYCTTPLYRQALACSQCDKPGTNPKQEGQPESAAST